jgi:DNA-binding transcriptional MerR regulator/methylmalonyl-CoA mutase cobalamin-binding subunit
MTIDREKPRYRIKAVSMKTGISPITIRAWERRYQILSPSREQNSYRLYSEVDISTLKWLKFMIDSGVQISQLALELKEMTTLGNTPAIPEDDLWEPRQTTESFPFSDTIDRLYKSLKEHDEVNASTIFNQAANSLPLIQLFEQLIIPMLIRIGEEWYTGKITVSTEHFASTLIRAWLILIYQRIPQKSKGPRVIIGGAPDDLHELGPLMLAILLREAGYAVEFLGPDNPLIDLAEYAAEENIRMVILSATTLESAMSLGQFKQILENKSPSLIFAYGGGAFSYKPELVQTTPGVFLGKTLSQSIERVHELLPLKK